jgi:pyrimidine deaminase RibD-like protein
MPDNQRDIDRQYMIMAIEEARKCRSAKRDDPLVGAVVVDKDGKLLGTAYRGELADGDHAEFTVLEKKLRSQVIAGATVYTTLEPCTKRSPEKIPCAVRLNDRKVSRVVIGMLDPNPDIRGSGVRLLQAAGITVEQFENDLWAQVEELNRDFRRRFETLQLHSPDRNLHDRDSATVLRAYVQRAEVRLSTMHRIAGAFLSGAGILILLPVLFRDSLSIIVKALAKFAVNQHWWEVGTYYVLPCMFILGIPLWSLWLLLKDLTLFYFTANIPSGQQPQAINIQRPVDAAVFHPRFALTAIPFADDESKTIKKRLRELQFNTSLMNFLLPQNRKEKRWLLDLVRTNDGERVALPHDEWLSGCYIDDNSDAMRMAFGLAGNYNRDLVEEAAKMELSLIRHNLYLRRLVVRYMKALLIIIWTAILFFVLSALIDQVASQWQIPAMLTGVWLWACLAPIIVRSPVRWIRLEYDQNTEDKTRDQHLIVFERRVTAICFILSIWSAVTLVYLLNNPLEWLSVAISIVVGGWAIYRSFWINRK